MTFLREQSDSASVSLSVHVPPKDSRTRLAAGDGKANAAVIRFFAKLFKIPRAAVTIAGGGKASRAKRIILAGVSLARAEAGLRPLLAPQAFPKRSVAEAFFSP